MTDHLIPKDKATVYLVGGAVRDNLLDRTVTERDWVVVGGTPELMLEHGFKKVGKDFPVFLHPQTHEEYALARTERKSARGYYGFDVHASPDVTLDEDLARRDLTVNAIAQTDDGEFVDPYGGRADTENRVLRHVSPAFSEDPLRVLRVARFAARYQPYGFRVADETLALMRHISESGELLALAGERLWQETVRALNEDTPVEYFHVLRAGGALAVLFPELEALYGVPQPAQWHPEIDTGIHNEMVLEQACTLSPDPEVRFAALCHDLGKGTTPKDILPSHHGHEARSEQLTKALCKRLKAPKSFRDLAVMTARFHGNCHKAFELKPSTLLKKIMAMDAARKPERFEKFLLACEADSRGRTGFEQRDYPQADFMRGALNALMAAQREVGRQAKTYDGDVAKLAHSLRLQAIKKYCAEFNTP